MNFDTKKIFFALIFTILVVNSFSQSVDKTLEFKKKGKRNNSVKIDFVTDSSNSKIAFLTHFENFSIVHLLDSSLNEIGQFEVQTKEKAFFKGGVFRGDSLLFCFFTDTYKETVLTTCHYSLSRKLLAQKNTDITFYNENALDMFLSGDKIFLLAAKNGEPVLNLHSFNTDGEKRGTKTYNFKSIISSVTNQPVSNFFSLDERRPVLIRKHFEPDFNTAIKAQRKIYVTADSLYILANTDAAITEVFSFSLNSNGQKYRSIYHPSALGIIAGERKKVKDNSFLCSRVLFYTAVNSDSLRFLVTDFATGKELQSFSAGRRDSIYFRNTALRRYGLDSKEIIENLLFKGESTSDLFNAMLNSNLVVYGEETSAGYEVMIGAYRRYLDKDATPFPATRVGTTPAMMYSSEEKEEIFEFVTIIDKLNNTHIPSIAGKTKSIRKKKEEMGKKKKLDMLDLQYLKLGTYELFLYYNSFRKHLKLYEWKADN